MGKCLFTKCVCTVPPTHCHQPQFVFLLKMRVNWPFCYMIPPRASLTHGDTFLDYKTADCHGVVMGISDHVITSCSFLCYLVSNHLAWPSWTILLRSKSNSFLANLTENCKVLLSYVLPKIIKVAFFLSFGKIYHSCEKFSISWEHFYGISKAAVFRSSYAICCFSMSRVQQHWTYLTMIRREIITKAFLQKISADVTSELLHCDRNKLMKWKWFVLS